jgi:hypothetical protein
MKLTNSTGRSVKACYGKVLNYCYQLLLYTISQQIS